MDRISKVIAYITREKEPGTCELLVFEHRDYPDAGVQVPAGTVGKGEAPEVAVMREVEEETGLPDCRLLRKVAAYDWSNPFTGQTIERHVYHLAAPPHTEETWTWIETDGGKVSELEGYVFQFRWVSLDDPPDLAGDQGAYLKALD